MKKRIYCRFDKDIISRLTKIGKDTRQLTQLQQSGYPVHYVYWPYFNGQSYVDRVGGIHHPSDGFLTDNNFDCVDIDEFIRVLSL